MNSLDLRGRDSPVVLLMVRRALLDLPPGGRLEVWLSCPRWARDLPRIVQRAGDACLASQATPQGYRLLLGRRAGRAPLP